MMKLTKTLSIVSVLANAHLFGTIAASLILLLFSPRLSALTQISELGGIEQCNLGNSKTCLLTQGNAQTSEDERGGKRNPVR